MNENPVKIIECPRDAWQGLSRQISSEIKAEYLRALVSAGFKQIDAVSFVSPRAVPQMADSEDVLKRLDPPDDVEIIAIVVNEKGADRALATDAVRTLGFPYSISETFLKKNQGQTAEENSEALESVWRKAEEADLGMVAYLSMAFGNPYGDLWNVDEVLQAVQNIADLGIKTVSLADTVGLATPEMVTEIVGAVVSEFEYLEVGAHLHGRKDDASAKILAAYDAGCRRFDSALGGLGGCPFAQDALVGNVPTEVVLRALTERGAQAPIRKPLDDVLRMNEDIALRFAR
ncbi:MAG TPA: hydroxymethylglutaryl-CoA lyase [Candidatus Saccharimonadales bacterium]|nr:hydroxymethylglutaryl-CoA lyase [Candidatus Saccharimonadales bacterium]